MNGAEDLEYLEQIRNKVPALEKNGVVSETHFQKAYEKVLQNLAQDREMLEQDYAFLFGDHTESFAGENGQKLATLFDKWRDADRAPSIPSIVLMAKKHLGIDEEDPCFQAALMTGIAAEIEVDNPYHDNHHFREIVTAALRLVNTTNQMSTQGEALYIDTAEVSKILLTAAAHDLNHDGTGNTVDGVHQQYRLEQKSIDTIKPFMKAAFMSVEDQKDVEAIIRVTDVSAPQGGKSPHMHLKTMVHDLETKGQIDSSSAPSELSRLATNPLLLQSAAILSDADLSPSAATTYDFNEKMTHALHGENHAIVAKPETTKFFCSVLVGGSFTSKAGRKQSQTALNAMVGTATRLIQEGMKNPPKNPTEKPKNTGNPNQVDLFKK